MQIADPTKVQQMVLALSNDYSRRILLSLASKGKSAEEVSQEDLIPISTCYRRIHDLLRCGLLSVEEIVLTATGRKYETYKSTFKEIKINLQYGQISVDATPNQDRADRLQNMWSSMNSQKQVETPSAENSIKAFPVLNPKTLSPIIADCDLCRAQKTWCRIFNCGESETEVFVCGNCEIRRMNERKKVNPQLVIKSEQNSN